MMTKRSRDDDTKHPIEDVAGTPCRRRMRQAESVSTLIRDWTSARRCGVASMGRTSCRRSRRRVWTVARGQLSNPMTIMLLIVCVASFAIARVATGVVVLGLVTFNVVMGSSQELKARASVEALAQLSRCRGLRVRRSGQVAEVESTELVPDGMVLLEAGDVVPADGGSSPPPHSRCRRPR